MIGKTISHYKILEKLGEGGMGVVYKAEDTKLKRKVALKFLSEEFTKNEDAVERFQREAQAAAALNHLNIVTIYEINEHNSQIYIAMEYVERQTLKQVFTPHPLPLAKVVDYTIQICEGLQKAHDAGIVHRDIKPQNILINKDGTVKILDFGLAKLKGVSQLTKDSSTLGTVHYMSPEQARGAEVDQRTDIWSLGVVLFEGITGELPFKGEYDQAVIYSVLNEAPKYPAFKDDYYPRVLQQIVKKCLIKDPEKRYHDIQDVTDEMKKIHHVQTAESDQKNPSIAVLPFVNMSADPEQEYFCDGMAEEIINALTQIKELKVVARTSAFFFKGKDVDIEEIGKKLKVDMVLEGSVRKAGNRLRITAQLINVADGYHLWSERYDRDLDDVFDIQDEVTLAIVHRMKLKLLGEEERQLIKRSTDNTEAYQFYLKGLYFSNKRIPEGYRKAIAFFDKAIEVDPKFTLPHAGLAFLYAVLGVFGLRCPKDVFPKAKSLYKKALEIDRNLAPAHSVKAYVNLFYDWNWPAVERDSNRAIELNPGYAFSYCIYAFYLGCMGRFTEAIREMKKAVNLDPLSLIINADMGLIYHFSRRYDEAIRWFRKTLEIESHYGLAFHHMGVTYAVQENYKEAEKCFIKALKLTGSLPWSVSWLSYVYSKLGKREKAESLIHELHDRFKKEYIHPSCFANAYSGLENYDKAFEYWNIAYEEREPLCCTFKVLPEFDRFRSDPRFDELLEKMHLK